MLADSSTTPTSLSLSALSTTWRSKAKLAIRNNITSGLLDAGLFQQDSHSLVPIPDCRVHHPLINTCALFVVECARAVGLQPYNEATGLGDLRYIQMTLACKEDAYLEEENGVQLVLVWNDTNTTHSPQLSALVDMLISSYSDCLHSIWVNFNTSTTNTILGRDYIHIWGEKEAAWATIGGTCIAFSPGSFLQANREGMAAALESIRRYCVTGRNNKSVRIVDLYAGVGTLGLGIAKQLTNASGVDDLSWIRFVEIVPWAKQPFEVSAARLMDEIRNDNNSDKKKKNSKAQPLKMEYYVSSVGTDPQQWLQDATVLLVDPPRKGLDKKLLEVLCNIKSISQLERVIYLSCGYDALENDCRKLVDSNQWTIQYVEAFLFFPGTDHIETLVVFDRVTT